MALRISVMAAVRGWMLRALLLGAFGCHRDRSRIEVRVGPADAIATEAERSEDARPLALDTGSNVSDVGAESTPDSGVAATTDAGTAELIEILVAKGSKADSPEIRTALWCNQSTRPYRTFYSNHVFSNLPAISEDGTSIVVVEEDFDDGPVSSGASLLVLDKASEVTRRVRLWTINEAEQMYNITPLPAAVCRAMQPVLHKRFEDAQAVLRSKDWRALRSLPKTYRVVPKYDYVETAPLADGGTEYRLTFASQLERIAVFEPAGTKILDLVPSDWISKKLARQPRTADGMVACSRAAPYPPMWVDEASKLLLLQFVAACHAHSVSDPPPLFFAQFY